MKKPFAIKLTIIAAILGIFIAETYFKVSGNDPHIFSVPPKEMSCATSNMAFCKIQREYAPVVVSQDFSLVLENQIPSFVTCPDIHEDICNNIPTHIYMKGYQIRNTNATTDTYSRNDYIATLRTFVATYGKLNFYGDIVSQQKGAVIFLNSAKTKEFILLFAYTGYTWQLQYPTYGNVTSLALNHNTALVSTL